MTSTASESTAVRLRPRTRARILRNVAPSKVGSANPNELAHLPRHCGARATPRVARRANWARTIAYDALSPSSHSGGNAKFRSPRAVRLYSFRRPLFPIWETYDATASVNAYLKGATYTLVGGGTLAPAS